MGRRLVTVTMVISLALLLGVQPGLTSPAIAGTSNSSVMFVENVGEFADGARFRVYAGGQTLWLADDALWITAEERPAPGAAALTDARSHPHLAATLAAADQPRRGVAVRLSFVDANPRPVIEPFNRLDTKVSYFLGNDPAKWRPDVPVWGGVRYRDVYPGLDLEVFGEGGQWNWRMAPRGETALGTQSAGTTLASVRLQVEGADTLAVQDSALRLATDVGDIRLPLLATTDVYGASFATQREAPEVQGNVVNAPFVVPNIGKNCQFAAESAPVVRARKCTTRAVTVGRNSWQLVVPRSVNGW